jgi:hypothetical protein
MQNRWARGIALIGNDLIAGVVEIEARECDHRPGSDRGGRRVGDGAFAGAEAAGRKPPVVREVDGGASLDVTQED